MASPNVIVTDYEPVRLDFCCGIYVVTFGTAKRIIVACWIFVVLGIVFTGFGIAAIVESKQLCVDFCFNSDPKTCACNSSSSSIVGFFLSAVLYIIGGAVVAQRCRAAIQALRMSKMNAPNQQVYPGVIQFQQPAYASIPPPQYAPKVPISHAQTAGKGQTRKQRKMDNLTGCQVSDN
ncbi:unnamed protein product [Darwinula stevensoni]|uniref:Uncharacterized protein n=1 Tax=Darwinula stevensoni TaxID=69355 RepID=A0A7R8XAZ5_9CRUS|nr:unnamed protein product [Darwinula stevensoni]CAG0891102.1 unnamed protein product [Darwinula stevensoni]